MKVRLKYELYEHDTLTEQMFARQGINKALGNGNMDMTQSNLSINISSSFVASDATTAVLLWDNFIAKC